MTSQSMTPISPSIHLLTRYECIRNVSEPFVKNHPLQFPIVCRISVPPGLMEKAFGKGFKANRNGNYALKEWDFMDNNFDRYLLFDYKGTTAFWGENMEPEEYEVIIVN